NELHSLVESGLPHRLQAGEIHKEEFFRESEILHEQAMAAEGTVRSWHYALIAVKPDRLKRGSRKRDGNSAGASIRIADQNTIEASEKQFVQRVDQPAFAIEIEAQLVDLEFAQIDVGRGAQLEAN